MSIVKSGIFRNAIEIFRLIDNSNNCSLSMTDQGSAAFFVYYRSPFFGYTFFDDNALIIDINFFLRNPDIRPSRRRLPGFPAETIPCSRFSFYHQC
jgi:hypothetical protein